jgi:RNA polymerase sigma-70 factor (ECF subfamily)
MYALCLRYLRESDDAQDVLLKAFTKVFEHLPRFKGEGSFEGWVRRIVVNEALMFLRKHKHRHITIELEEAAASVEQYPQLEADDLLQLVQALPEGYRTVFNLHAIEGYAHAEIAEQLGISEGTSKSQLSRAKELLRQQIANHDRGYRDQLG